LFICEHNKTLINSVGEIVKDCDICYTKMLKDYEKMFGPAKAKPEPKVAPRPVRNLFI